MPRKPPYLYDGEQHAILADDQIVEITYFLVRRVVDCLAPEFAEAVAIGYCDHIDHDERHRCRDDSRDKRGRYGSTGQQRRQPLILERATPAPELRIIATLPIHFH